MLPTEAEPSRKKDSTVPQSLYMRVDQTLNGDRALIVETLDGLAGALQSEVSARETDTKPSRKTVDTSTFQKPRPKLGQTGRNTAFLA